MDHAAAISAITDWAVTDENIRVVLLTGSVARGLQEVDELSDLDVELYVVDPAPLLGDDSWYAPFGEVLVTEALPNPRSARDQARLLRRREDRLHDRALRQPALGDAGSPCPGRALLGALRRDRDGSVARPRRRHLSVWRRMSHGAGATDLS